MRPEADEHTGTHWELTVVTAGMAFPVTVSHSVWALTQSRALVLPARAGVPQRGQQGREPPRLGSETLGVASAV